MTRLLDTRRGFVLILALGLLSLAARGIADPDFWWHLRTGQLIVETRGIPHTDPFSATRQGQPWVTHEWLSEVLMYGTYRVAGWGGLIGLSAAIIAAAFFLLYLRCPDRPYLAALMTLWGAFASAPTWGVRPQMLSLLLSSLFLLLVERSRQNPHVLWWCVPLMILWVNLHAGFAAGIVLLGLFTAGWWADAALGFEPRSTALPRLRTLSAVLAVCFLVVPLNPNGMRLYSYPLHTLRSPAMQTYISEWFSPDFHLGRFQFLLALLLVTFAAFSWSKMQTRPSQLLLLTVTAYGALQSVRHIPFFVLIAVPLVAERLLAGIESRGWMQRLTAAPPAPTRAKVALNLALLVAVAAFAVVYLTYRVRRQAESEATNFPAGAARFLAEHPLACPLFNHYDWGGYLIWKLYPQYRVSLDGRADLYGNQFMQEFADTYQLRNDWQRSLRERNVCAVLVPWDSPLASGLEHDREWRLLYRDAQAVIYFRSAASSPLISRLPG